MAEPYLAELQIIVERACAPSAKAMDISCRHFFAGAAAYVGDRIFMTLTPVGLALKLADVDRNSLFDQGAKPLRYFPNAPVKKEYALLPTHISDDHGVLSEWISRSIEFSQK